MIRPDRREFTAGLGAAVFGTSLYGFPAIAQAAPKVVIIGGGPGGATVANQLSQAQPKIEVTLIEVQPRYTTCFFSNLYLGGFRTFQSITHDYSGLRQRGVKVVRELATDVDTAKKVVRTQSGGSYPYDRLVVSPGIDLKYDTIEGYSRAASLLMPHAYQAGTQTTLLKRQLERMRNGGVVVMAAPNNPYRCPPGPYERACMIAHFLKTRKPKSKLVILDPKRAFSKQPVFMEAFQRYYKDNLELNLSTELDDFTVVKVDPKAMVVTTKGGKTVKADVANIIPNQRAGEIAHKAGLAEGDWCPVNLESFVSRKVSGVYVLGDASVAAEMPKSAFSANSQAKVVAADIVAELSGKPKFPATYRNTCWSMLAPDDSVKIGANYTPKDGKLEPSGSFVSKPGEDAAMHKANYEESLGWYSGITTDIFAKGPATETAKGKTKA
jgi:NADPH-dependent 2,4-dienoyl-CoA reductase/sulfur reductase-like enzyme